MKKFFAWWIVSTVLSAPAFAIIAAADYYSATIHYRISVFDPVDKTFLFPIGDRDWTEEEMLARVKAWENDYMLKNGLFRSHQVNPDSSNPDQYLRGPLNEFGDPYVDEVYKTVGEEPLDYSRIEFYKIARESHLSGNDYVDLQTWLLGPIVWLFSFPFLAAIFWAFRTVFRKEAA